MDRSALRELFDYTTFTWTSYGKSVRGLSPEDFTRTVDGSGWPSLRDALFHLASAWDGWICEETKTELQPMERDDAPAWTDVNAVRERMRPLLRGIIDDTPDAQMREPILGFFDGAPELARAEVIAHILLHERGHHGDVSTLLSALGAEVPNIDYMTYVFFRNRKK